MDAPLASQEEWPIS